MPRIELDNKPAVIVLSSRPPVMGIVFIIRSSSYHLEWNASKIPKDNDVVSESPTSCGLHPL